MSDIDNGADLAPDTDISAVETTEKVDVLSDIISKAMNGDEVADTSSDRSRDNAGRFAKAEQQSAQAPAMQSALEPPARWTEEDKAAFKSWTPDVQKAVLQRHEAMEADYTRKTQDISEYRKTAQPIIEALAPHGEYLAGVSNQLRTSIPQMLGALVATEQALRVGSPAQKIQVLTNLARSYGIPLNAIAGGQQPGQQPSADDPRFHPLASEITNLRSTVQQLQGAEHERLKATVKNDLEAFKSAKDESGNLKHPFFEDVAPYMGDLIRSGQAKDFADAYELATAPIRKALEKSGGMFQSSSREAVNKAKQAASPRAVGTKANGATKPKGLDAHLSNALSSMFGN